MPERIRHKKSRPTIWARDSVFSPPGFDIVGFFMGKIKKGGIIMILKCWTVDDEEAEQAKIIRMEYADGEINLLETFSPKLVDIPLPSEEAFIGTNFNTDAIRWASFETKSQLVWIGL
ncbi:MAG: hypothetical protein IID12_07345 [Candidatus Marinimicrobia bacterium]|nr:hypothetical protein [Candidatus Neomarinimicrobiota bacterium]